MRNNKFNHVEKYLVRGGKHKGEVKKIKNTTNSKKYKKVWKNLVSIHPLELNHFLVTKQFVSKLLLVTRHKTQMTY